METKPLNPPPFSPQPDNNKTRLYKMPAELQRPAQADNSTRNATIAGAAAGVAGAAAGFAAGTFSASAAKPETEDANPEIEEIATEGNTVNTPQENQNPYNDTFDQPVSTSPSPAPETAPDERSEIVVEPIENDWEDDILPDYPDPYEPGDDTVDTDDIADAIIAEDLIDPYDYEPVDMLGSMEVLDIGEITLEDGSDVTVASFTIDGDLYGMVDLNNDGEMDLVIDSQGESQWVAGIMTSDLEEQMANPDEYLAYDETIENDLSIGLDIDQDIING